MKILVAIGIVLYPGAAWATPPRLQELPDLKTSSVVELIQRLDDPSQSEAILVEIIRCGGEASEKVLAKKLEERTEKLKAAREKVELLTREKKTQEKDLQETTLHRLEKNLELLTALRRVQKKPDPLAIEIRTVADIEAWKQLHNGRRRETGPLQTDVERLAESEKKLNQLENELTAAVQELSKIDQQRDPQAKEVAAALVRRLHHEHVRARVECKRDRICVEQSARVKEQPVTKPIQCTIDRLPELVAILRSADSEHLPFGMQLGGDYRSGRMTRWRVEVRDSAGRVVPPLHERDSGRGGGFLKDGWMPSEETWLTVLPMSDYVKLPGLGEYTVTVMYHDHVEIARINDPRDLDQLIVFRSPPFKVQVIPKVKRKIVLDPESQKTTAVLVQQLPTQGIVQVIQAKYDKSFYDFIEPNSAAGKLLTMDWQAVPGLLRALEDGKLTPHQNAWVFSLLFSITREKSLSPLDYRRRQFVLPQFRSKIMADWGGHDGTSNLQEISVEKQARLILDWREFADANWEIHEVPENPQPVKQP